MKMIWPLPSRAPPCKETDISKHGPPEVRQGVAWDRGEEGSVLPELGARRSSREKAYADLPAVLEAPREEGVWRVGMSGLGVDAPMPRAWPRLSLVGHRQWLKPCCLEPGRAQTLPQQKHNLGLLSVHPRGICPAEAKDGGAVTVLESEEVKPCLQRLTRALGSQDSFRDAHLASQIASHLNSRPQNSAPHVGT